MAKGKTQNEAPKMTGGIEQIEISKITSVLFERVDMGDLDELARSMAKTTQLQPILVRELPNGEYQVIAGFRRFQAAKRAGFKTIEAKIVNVDEKTAYIMALAENVVRKELTDFEVAQIIQGLINQGLKASEIASKLGKSSAWVSTKLSVLKAPEDVKEAVKAGKITAEHARVLSRVKDEKERKKAIERAMESKLTVKEAKKAREKAEQKEEQREKLEREINKLRRKLEEYKKTLQEEIEAENRIPQIEQRIVEIEQEINKINAELREMKSKLPSGIEFDLETVSDRIEKIELDYKNAIKSVEENEETLKQLENKLEETKVVTVTVKEWVEEKDEEGNVRRVLKEVEKKFDVNDVVEQEYKTIFEKKKAEVIELEKRLRELRRERDNAENVVKAIQRAKRERERLTKQVETQKDKLSSAKKYLRDFEKKNAEILMNAETWKKLGETAKELINQRIKLAKEKAELEEEKRKLTSRKNNKDKTQKAIAELEKQIKELEAQLKQHS